MDLKLTDKVVLITGSGQGLGKGIVRSFLKEGANALITDIHQDRINETLSELKRDFPKNKVIAFCGDLTKQNDIKLCVEYTLKSFGRIDILIANLGSGRGTIEWNISEDDWTNMIELNFSGARRITYEVIPAMMKQNGGSIIFISSIAGIEVIDAPIHYSVAKASIIVFSKNLSRKLARNNIRINTICPGNIYFENGTWDIKLKENMKKVLEILDTTVPQNRFASTEEIANMVVFISSEKASFVTGSCIIIDGGQTTKI